MKKNSGLREILTHELWDTGAVEKLQQMNKWQKLKNIIFMDLAREHLSIKKKSESMIA